MSESAIIFQQIALVIVSISLGMAIEYRTGVMSKLIRFFDNGLLFWGMSVAMYGLGRKLYYQIIGLINEFKK